ncbi:MAG: carbohydrate ABC transporter permease [Alicyclobacillus herbarius]|uniref:carbohydrate ABC transporter permease n=1 Tax=Alicyclobacillus herbarius TaxID=122960 RepID=UPI002353B98F|nr:carbohydrate ABC transporter permease [Alicyclobacillus herbarius]MCL6631167.1 carbohydrate ABC transporter permease [Alicyclobacillus herbarius]
MTANNLRVKLVTYAFLVVAAIVSIYPFYWMFISSTLDDTQIFHQPPWLVPSTHFAENLQGLESSGPFWHILWNTFFISAVFTLATVYLSAVAGYAFAKFEFRGKNVLFAIVLLTMMIPQQATLIPLFKMLTGFGWMNQPQAVILPALANAFGVFFMRQNMLSVPTDLMEAARIDGCTEIGIFHRIILPTVYPALSALTILSFIQQWGNFLWPLVILQSQTSTTLPVFLSLLVTPGQVVHYGQVLTGAAIGILPILILFLVFQKYFISGIYGGAVKG